MQFALFVFNFKVHTLLGFIYEVQLCSGNKVI